VTDVQANIDALLQEHRVFEPPEGFAQRAIVSDPSIYERASADPEAFWAEQAERLSWSRRWDTVMDWNPPWVTWFAGGTLNASYNCLDRHVEAGGGDKVA
jgi:acetyl-CoA synthetase